MKAIRNKVSATYNLPRITRTTIVMETAQELARAVLETVNSSYFKKEEIRQHKLTLSQGYCLLWHETKSGDVCGRQCGTESNAGATAAVLVDLVVLERGELEADASACGKEDSLAFKLLLDKRCGNYLDAAMLDKIVNQSNEHPKKFHYVKDLIYEDIRQKDANQRCATKALDSMVARGIFLVETQPCGSRKYPTVKPEVQKELVEEIRAVALEGGVPSSYLRALLTIARTADNLSCLNFDPVLKKYFSKQEYRTAKEVIDGLVGLDRIHTHKK